MSVYPRKFRKKPIEIEAVRFMGGPDAALNIVKWILDSGGKASYETTDMDTVTGMVSIATLEGRIYASPGDYVIKGIHGEFYPCKPDIFQETYDAVTTLNLSDANRLLLLRAYDDGDGNTITLGVGSNEGYFVGVWEDCEMMEGTEIDGVLYSICHESGGCVSVLVGSEIVENVLGPTFRTTAEARAYIRGLVSK